MDQLACLFHPINCVQDALQAVPLGYYILGAFGLGVIIGAITRWAGVATFFVAVLAVAFGLRKKDTDDDQHDLPFPDGLPPMRKKPSKPPKKRKTLAEILAGFGK